MRARHPDTSVLAVTLDGARETFPRVVRVVFADVAAIEAVQAVDGGHSLPRISDVAC